MTAPWFGPWLLTKWYGAWMPGYAPSTLFLGYGPGGVATFAIDLESGFKVIWDWGTDIDKSYSGQEKREARRDAPKQSYEGASLLLGDDPARVRGQLAALMAVGSPFLLGLQYEGLSLVKDAVGSTVYVNPAMIPYCDWLVPGQRAITKDHEDVAVFKNVVIQSVDPVTGATVLDGIPGVSGNRYCELMPAMAVFFEPQQNFARYPENAERWDMAARSAIFDFNPPRAYLDLATIHAGWASAKLVAIPTGVTGNTVGAWLTCSPTAPVGGSLTEFPTAGISIINMKGGVDTLGAMATLINNNSALLKMTGTFVPGTVIATTDAFTSFLAGGSSVGLAGSGAALTVYDGRYVWDWPIVVETSGQDSIQSMISMIDFGGVPVVMATADEPDFGRHVMIRDGHRQTFQWLKKFLWSVKGSQKAFWLPTYRPDLTWTAGSGVTITVKGDVASWYPKINNRLAVYETGGVVVYAKILGTVRNNDGTTTLTLDHAVDNIAMICWLELCRFETSKFEVIWNSQMFEMISLARVVQQ